MANRLHVAVHRFLRRLLLPDRLRSLRGREMDATLLESLAHGRAAAGRWGVLRVWRHELLDLLRTGLRLRLRGARPTPHPESLSMIDHTLQDLRLTLRGLARDPGWTAAAMLTLALAIGATTAIYTVVQTVLLEPLPFDEPDRLLAIGPWDIANERGSASGHTSYPLFEALQSLELPLESLGAYSGRELSLYFDGVAEQVRGAYATASVFRALRTVPEHGGLYDDSSDVEGGPAAVLVGHGFWQRRLGGDPDAVGTTLMIDETPHTIVGVLGPRFAFPDPETELWISMATANRSPWSSRLRMVGRVAPEIPVPRAIERLRALAVEAPNDPSRAYAALAVPLRESLAAGVRHQLMVFSAAALAVLLIASLNVVNLMLARESRRTGEHALRAALGASRGRLVRQVLTESLALSVVGAALGVGLAGFLTRVFVDLSPVSVPRREEIAIDSSVLLFTLVLTVGVGLLVGILPALRGAVGSQGAALGGDGRGATGGRGQGRLRSGLIVAQISLALVLLFSAGLLVQTLAGMLQVDRGYDAEPVLTVSTALPATSYPDHASRAALYETVLTRVRALPDVLSAGLATLPPYGSRSRSRVAIEGYTPAEGESMWVDYLVVTPDFFPTLGIRLLAGRLLTEQDTDPAVLVNQAMARRYWPEGGALGSQLTLGEGEPATVVGIVNDTRYASLGAADIAQVYRPFDRGDTDDMMLFVRTQGDPRALRVPIREFFQEADPQVAISDLMTIDDRLWNATAEERFRAVLLAAFGTTALLLAMTGAYGVIAYDVGRRIRELGIRKALGADDGRLLRRVLRHAASLAVLGTLVGTLGCWFAAMLLEGYLFGVQARDPSTFALAVVALTAAVLVAAWVPGRRAASVDPIMALRAE